MAERPDRSHWAVPVCALALFLLPPSAASSDDAIFIDVTRESGVDFLHFNGATGEYTLAEIMGSGGALFDYDNDGDLDLYLVQGSSLTSNDRPSKQGGKVLRGRLFRNDTSANKRIRFTDVTSKSGIEAHGYGMGAAAADYDNDGWVDLYVTNLGSNQMFRNNGNGTFTDVTARTGTNDSRWSSSATFFDYDRDGWLDLFVVNYVDFSMKMGRKCYSKGSARDYCGPESYAPVSDSLFHNRGDGTFENVSARSGITRARAAGLGVIAADLNGDGWTDVYVANDGDPNQFWINQGGKGTFKDEAMLAGVALSAMGLPQAGMGVDVADLDGDGNEDIFVTNLEGESNTLYVNLGGGLFEDRTIDSGLRLPSLRHTAFGTRFLDYDNDGRLDLLVLNGAVRMLGRLAREGATFPLQEPNQLYRGSGMKFVDVSQSAGPAFQIAEVSRGAIFGDIDNDGDTDVVVCNNSGPARVLVNAVGNRNHWIGLRLLDATGKRAALGARVELQGIWRRVHGDGSYLSTSDTRVLIGLGNERRPRTIRIHWPDGKTQVVKDLAVDRYWTIRQGSPPQ